MKKVLLLSVSSLLLVSSCGTYAGSGAYNGSAIGSVLGSAIGGISGGHRGSDIGTIVGMAGGAVIGGAIGAAADKSRQRDIEEAVAQRRQNRNYDSRQSDSDIYYSQTDDSGFDPNNSGDDRLDWGTVPTPTAPSQAYNTINGIDIRNIRFLDDNNDGMLSAGETAKVVFEVMNYTSSPLHNVKPSVLEAGGNRHIYVSQGICVERIAPGKGIRYTAMIKGDNRLKDGDARFVISVSSDDKKDDIRMEELSVRTSRN